MAVSVHRKKPRKLKKYETHIFGFLYSLVAKIFFQIPAAIFILLFIFIWSSSTTIISGNVVHVCVSSRKLNNLYCLSAGTQPDFHIPISDPGVINATNSNDPKAIINGDNEQGVELKETTDPATDLGYNKSSVPLDGTEKNGNITLHEAFRDVEAQIRMQRSWISSSNHATTCEERGIYVYELPPKFNKDLMEQCNDMIPWLEDFCKFFSNGALGEAIQNLGDGWYDTHQYSLEPIFHAKILKHPCRVYNQNDAKLFYVPYYGGLDVLRWHFKNVTHDVKDALAFEVVRWLESQESWYKNLGKDHVFALGKITWDFRRNDESLWGTRFLELDEMQNPIKLLIERQPWNVNEVGIPHPTFFHPKTDEDIVKWQLNIMKSNRRNLVSFAGAPRPDSPESIRSVLIDQCISMKNEECKFLNCTTGECGRPEKIIKLFLESEFCLQPPGDSPTRKSVFDSLVSGCIPVMFDPFTAYYEYPWHLPEDREKYSVFVDKEEVRKNGVNVVERLMKIPGKERENMRRYIIYELLPGLVYGHVDAKFDKFQDAFSITVDNLLERVNRLNEL